MGRLTVRLPGTLHQRLRTLAESEGASLNQFIVYALTREATLSYHVEPVSQKAVAEQRALYGALRETLGHASTAEIEARMAEREDVTSESGLDPEVAQRIRALLADRVPAE